MFLQFHMLTAFPPHNVNRDEDGRPKTTIYGGVLRGRISSQARKRAIRMAGGFSGYEWANGTLKAPSATEGLHRATRTREAGLLVYDRLRAKGVAAFPAVLAAQAVTYALGGAATAPPLSPKDTATAVEEAEATTPVPEGSDPSEALTTEAQSGKKRVNKPKLSPFDAVRAQVSKLEASEPEPQDLRKILCVGKQAGVALVTSKQGLVLSTREIARLVEHLDELDATSEDAVLAWAREVAKDGLLLKEDVDEDIALFGRMVAANPVFNEEAAVSLSHAITTHAYGPEGDYFSAGEEL